VQEFAAEVRRRWGLAEGHLRQCARVSFVPPAGGFYVTLRLDAIEEEGAALAALRDEHLLLHPGYYYDMKPNHLVLSFILDPEVIRCALPRLIRTLDRHANV
jgi:DNA-binding transcriptional MocR family regulator